MNYFQQIAERLLQPGTFLLVLGAILVYTSGIVARKLFSGSEKAISVLGWNPARSTMQQMVADAWRWHQNGGYAR